MADQTFLLFWSGSRVSLIALLLLAFFHPGPKLDRFAVAPSLFALFVMGLESPTLHVLRGQKAMERRQSDPVSAQGGRRPGEAGQSTTPENQTRRVKMFDRPLRESAFPVGILIAILLILALIVLAVYVF